MPETAVPDEAWSPSASGPGRPPSNLELPGYRDFELFASGGDSTVYKARQVGIDRPVAVKVLAADPDGGHVSAARFQRELEITVRLGRAHPHIITVLDTHVLADGRPCIVMDFYDHGSLHDQLRSRGPLPVNAVVAVGTVVADALAFAHAQGVLHRDVKPQNILVLPTSYVLADFGLARHTDAGHSSSLERFSYRHAAPQILDGELPTVADDIYSLGSTLFTLLDGRPPFATDDAETDTALAYLRRVRTEPPRPIRTKGVPDRLIAIVDRCLAKRREDRFPDAASVRDALASVAVEDRAWAPQSMSAPATAPVSAPPADSGAWPATSGSSPAVPVSAPPSNSGNWPATSGGSTAGAGGWSVAPPAAGPPAVHTPMDAAPPPVARSVIEHIESRRPARPPDPARIVADAVPTGLRPDVPAELPPPPAPPRARWPRMAALIGAALVVGAVIGLGGSWLRTAFTPREPVSPTRPVPTFTGALPSATVSGLPNDIGIAPEIVALDDRGNTIELRWIDKSGGTAVFAVVEVSGAQAQPMLQVSSGQTVAVLNGLDSAAARYCFQVIAITTTHRGVSQIRCTEARPTG